MLIVDIARAAVAYEAPLPGSTRDSLIVAAERLFALQSIEGPSLRTISAEAGQGNTRALQYHFGGRQGILAAILLTRLGGMERRRRHLLSAALVGDAPPEMKNILGVVFRPLAETVDQNGHNMFIRVLGQLLISTQYYASQLDLPATIDAFPTVTEQVLQILAEQTPMLSDARLASRLAHVLRMFVGAVIDRESSLFAGLPCPDIEETIAEQLEMGAAALFA